MHQCERDHGLWISGGLDTSLDIGGWTVEVVFSSTHLGVHLSEDSPGDTITSSLVKQEIEVCWTEGTVLSAFYKCVVKVSSPPSSDPISHQFNSLWSSKIMALTSHTWG